MNQFILTESIVFMAYPWFIPIGAIPGVSIAASIADLIERKRWR